MFHIFHFFTNGAGSFRESVFTAVFSEKRCLTSVPVSCYHIDISATVRTVQCLPPPQS